MLFKNQVSYPDVDVTLLRRVEADDPASIPDRETFVARRSDGMEVYVTREDFDEKEFARAEEAMRSAEAVEPLPEVSGGAAVDATKKEEAAADSKDDDTKKNVSSAEARAGSSVTSSSTSIPPSGRR